MTSKIALYLIAACGFGMTLGWETNDGQAINGLTLNDCFQIASTSVYARIFLPQWVFRLPFKPLRRIHDANVVLETILQQLIEKRRKEGVALQGSRAEEDVFSLLLNANAQETDPKSTLSDAELIGNVFLLLVAGHETTSHALASALGLLACHPEVQERAYREIMSAKHDVDPTFEESDSLVYLQACVLEAIRIFPSVAGMPRRATEDTVLHVPSKTGATFDLPVKKDQYIVIDPFGICYNPQLYPNPDQYRPERWLDPTIEPGLNFSTGPRVCIGRKFAYAECTAILAMLIRDWKMEPILKPGETLREWRLRCLDGNVANSLGFGPQAFPLRFIHRD